MNGEDFSVGQMNMSDFGRAHPEWAILKLQTLILENDVEGVDGSPGPWRTHWRTTASHFFPEDAQWITRR